MQSIEGSASKNDITIDNNILVIEKELYLNISHGVKNYVFTIPANTSFSLNNNYAESILYFEVDPLTAEISLKESNNLLYDFNSVVDTLPTQGEDGQLLFSKNSLCLHHWEGFWRELIGIPLGKKEDSKIKKLYTNQSQANINSEIISFEIERNRDLDPIRIERSDRVYFLTKDESEKMGFSNVDVLGFEHVLCENISDQSMNPFTVLSRERDNRVRPTSPNTIEPAIALLLHACLPNESSITLEYGFVRNPHWMWTEPPMTPLYVGLNGELTTTSPLELKSAGMNGIISAQKVGYIVDRDVIFFDPLERYILETVERSYILT